MKIPEILKVIRPNALWALNGDSYEGLDWLDTVQTKPSISEITDAWPAVQLAADNEAFNAPLKAQIAALDLKRIRPLAEGDTAYLAKLNEQIVALRAQLK